MFKCTMGTGACTLPADRTREREDFEAVSGKHSDQWLSFADPKES